MLKKVLVGLVIIVALAGAGGLGFIAWIGAWNIVFPSHSHDTVAPQIPASLVQGGVLVFSKTNSFRHKEGIPAGLALLAQLAADADTPLFHTENGAVFNPADLSRFAVVVFLHATGDMLSEAQELAFQDWLTGGGAWLGIHAAGDGSHAGWTWYTENLLGAEYIAHPMDPQFQVAEVQMEPIEHPVISGIPQSWTHEEEWYSWKQSPRGGPFTVLATVDEDSYSPYQKMFGETVDLHMGDHPIAWGRCIGAGWAVYSALGHLAAAYEQPQHRQLLQNSLNWLLAVSGTACVDFNPGSEIIKPEQ